MATLLWSSLEAKRNIPSTGNIRTVLSPLQIAKIIYEKSGMVLGKQAIRETGKGMRDGEWEVGSLLRGRERELEVLRRRGVDERDVAVLEASFDTLYTATNVLNGGVKGLRCMDFWVVVFVREHC